LKAEQFDFVILDIKLPDIDGYTVLKHVRKFSDVPIIVITAYGNNESRALEMGANAYFMKPFKVSDMVNRINAIICTMVPTSKESPLTRRKDNYAV
jgi:DNA-binding response OmpR family regulator